MKTDIREDVKGLEFIKMLRPVTYNRSTKAILRITGNTDTLKYAARNDIEKIRFTGFVAQEVEEAAKLIGYNFDGVHAPKTQARLLLA